MQGWKWKDHRKSPSQQTHQQNCQGFNFVTVVSNMIVRRECNYKHLCATFGVSAQVQHFIPSKCHIWKKYIYLSRLTCLVSVLILLEDYRLFSVHDMPKTSQANSQYLYPIGSMFRPHLPIKVRKSTSPWILYGYGMQIPQVHVLFRLLWWQAVVIGSLRILMALEHSRWSTVVSNDFLLFLWNLRWSLNLRCRFVQNLGSSRRLRTVGDQKHPGKSSGFFGAGPIFWTMPWYEWYNQQHVSVLSSCPFIRPFIQFRM